MRSGESENLADFIAALLQQSRFCSGRTFGSVMLAADGVDSYPKTSGKKGIHVVVPIKRLYSWKQLHQTSGKIAASLAKRFPQTFTATMGKSNRTGISSPAGNRSRIPPRTAYSPGSRTVEERL